MSCTDFLPYWDVEDLTAFFGWHKLDYAISRSKDGVLEHVIIGPIEVPSAPIATTDPAVIACACAARVRYHQLWREFARETALAELEVTRAQYRSAREVLRLLAHNDNGDYAAYQFTAGTPKACHKSVFLQSMTEDQEIKESLARPNVRAEALDIWRKRVQRRVARGVAEAARLGVPNRFGELRMSANDNWLESLESRMFGILVPAFQRLYPRPLVAKRQIVTISIACAGDCQTSKKPELNCDGRLLFPKGSIDVIEHQLRVPSDWLRMVHHAGLVVIDNRLCLEAEMIGKLLDYDMWSVVLVTRTHGYGVRPARLLAVPAMDVVGRTESALLTALRKKIRLDAATSNPRQSKSSPTVKALSGVAGVT